MSFLIKELLGKLFLTSSLSFLVLALGEQTLVEFVLFALSKLGSLHLTLQKDRG